MMAKRQDVTPLAPTVAEALAHPALAGAELLGGEGGLGRRILWVHVSELLDVARFLQGGELLLTTGMALAGADRRAQEAYLDSLAERGIAALGVELVQWIRELPPWFPAWAERAGIPLLVFREEVRFEAIGQALCSLILNRKTALLETLETTTEALLQGLSRDGLGGFLEALQARLPGHQVAVRLGEDGGGEGLWLPLRAGPETLGALGVFPREGLDEAAHLVLERAALILAAHLAMARAQEEAKRREALERLSAFFFPDLFPGFPPYHPAWLGLALGTEKGDLRTLLTREGLEVWSWKTPDLRLFLLGGPRPLLEEVHREAEAQARSGVPLGVGPVVEGVHLAHHTLREATWRLRCGKDPLGLLLIPDPTLRLAYARARLAPLLALPPRRRRALGETLRALLEEASRAQTARRLGIRRQSLYRRLEELETLLGPLSPGRVDLFLALKILREMAPGEI
jgi:purine catabolism regulator